MSLDTCTICDKETDNKCAKCKSAAYCSQECQKLDFPLHKLLCSKIATFIADNPRPADEYMSTHKLGLLFPVDGHQPELIWVKNTTQFEKLGHHFYLTTDLKAHIPDARQPQLAEHGENKLEVYMGSAAYFREPPNECIKHLMAGYQWTDGGNPISAYRWVGNIVVLRYEPWELCHDEEYDESQCKTYEDVTAADLRYALEFLGRDVKVFEAESPNKFFVRDENMWMKGVKISCSGDMTLLGKKEFRDVLVSRYNDICVRKQLSSTISAHLGFELLVMKCAFQKLVEEAVFRGVGGLTENLSSAYLMIDATPHMNNGCWGIPDPNKWDTSIDPTVLVVRKDMGDITAKQVEALVAYCSDVVEEAMKGDPDYGCFKTHERQAIVSEYLTLDKFRAFFETFKKDKVDAGDASWSDATLPQVPAPERAPLSKDIINELSMLALTS